jgi:hypothetical protein
MREQHEMDVLERLGYNGGIFGNGGGHIYMGSVDEFLGQISKDVLLQRSS